MPTDHPVKRNAVKKTSLGTMIDLAKLSKTERAAFLTRLRESQFSDRKTVSPNEFGDAVNVKGDSIRTRCRRGEIAATQDAAGRWHIPVSEIPKFAKVKKMGGGPKQDRAKLVIYILWPDLPRFKAFLARENMLEGSRLSYYNRPGPSSQRPELSSF